MAYFNKLNNVKFSFTYAFTYAFYLKQNKKISLADNFFGKT